MKEYMRINMSDGSVWEVPVLAIAIDRATHHAGDYDHMLVKSLMEDTIPLFEDEDEIVDWAINNMDWADVAPVARKVQDNDIMDYDDEWAEGEKTFI